MHRELFSWHSPELNRGISVARWGHYGKPVLFFPTGGGDFLDCERFLMVRALRPLIDAGKIKLYAVESVSRDWVNPEISPARKSETQVRYDNYLVKELCPFIQRDCGGTEQRFAAAGASLGGYDALNAASKHPEFFDRMIGMSGTYVLDRRMNGHWDQNYYFNNPVQFLPNLERTSSQYQDLQKSLFVFARGNGPYESRAYIDQVAPVFRSCSIPHRVEIWSKDADHDWPTWRTMLPLFLNRLL
jgi:esterase/lipase superfamily enzyme